MLHHRTIESERVEYQVGWNLESVLLSICAFANDFYNLGGGYVAADDERNSFLIRLLVHEGVAGEVVAPEGTK